jgi:hypothetical protein
VQGVIMHIPYVYYVKNKITNEFYYGSRAGNVRKKLTPEEDFWIIYFTSSTKVKNLIQRYGVASFEFSIVHRDSSYEKCYWVEQQLIKESRKNVLSLNGTFIDPLTGIKKFSIHGRGTLEEISRGEAISRGKKGKSNGRLGFKHSIETKEKMRIAQAKIHYTHNEETRNKMKQYRKTPEHAAKIGNAMRGKPWSDARRLAQKDKQ